jgi:hypothetical protein
MQDIQALLGFQATFVELKLVAPNAAITAPPLPWRGIDVDDNGCVAETAQISKHNKIDLLNEAGQSNVG